MKKLLIAIAGTVLISCKGTYTIISKSDCEQHQSGIICKVILEDKRLNKYETYVKIQSYDTTTYELKKMKFYKRQVNDNVHAIKIN